MQIQKSNQIFLNFIKTCVNRNLIIKEEEILEEFEKNNDLKTYRETNRQLFKDVYQLKYLNDYILDPKINEIILHDYETIQFEKDGKLQTKFLQGLNESIYSTSLETLALKNKVIWNYSSPFASFYTELERLPFRASLIHESCGFMKKPKLFLRRIKTSLYSVSEFGLNPKEELELKKQIAQKKNILLAGAAGSGKSSLLASLLNNVPESEHVIILEDTHEIPTFRKNFTHFLANENLPNKSLRTLCAFSLRLRPDRIMLGEIRSNEIIPYILAMNTGNKGMMSTIHSDSAIDAVSRMALLFIIHGENQALSFEMALKIICKNIDVVIYLKDKKIKEIIKIIGSDKGIANYDYLFRNNLS